MRSGDALPPEGRRFIRSVGHAVRGLYAAFRDEPNMRIHGWMAAFAVGLGAAVGLTPARWLLLAGTILGVWFAELMNTAVERAVDHAGAHRSEAARTAKDAASAAVLLSALWSVAVGFFLFYEPLIDLAAALRQSAGGGRWGAFALLGLVGYGLLARLRPAARLSPALGLFFAASALAFWGAWLPPVNMLTFVLPPLAAVFTRRSAGSWAALAAWATLFGAAGWAAPFWWPR
ncbi:MAG: diacylglycerol kinase family protein [Hydrogenibacillus schlegelii]|nr:diacylglycerol kinase family protein [Hydrogenibacillus schlegelii]